ncbi:MAG TPA: magnesium chelatase ATPase subunit I, partial [Pyrinomonadaceae bacterium]|nr:magnesium chelatase ATPase subunit I [Pyrinomonadaceae bacterium]
MSRKNKAKKDAMAGNDRTLNAYPFTAIVGQDEARLGLILNLIDPLIGGVLMMGHRGTGKSTAVRALANLLPDITVSEGCSFGCDPRNTSKLCANCTRTLSETGRLKTKEVRVPVIDLPLGATEDRVCGSINIQRALSEGVTAFEPGLLARANRGFLYIDEVNLLEDHLVDLLLDVAVTGRNVVERENVSIEHAAEFVLVGSGNPEEGELRPQLIDRFGLYVQVETENDPDERVEILSRRDAFDRDRNSFLAAYAEQQEELQNRITRARKAMARIELRKDVLKKIALLCSELRVEGHRGELTIMRAARALAAFEGRKVVRDNDVRRVAMMALRHRLHGDSISDTASETRIRQALENL